MSLNFRRPAGVLAGFHAEPGPVEPSVAESVGFAHGGEQWASTEYIVGRHRHAMWELYLQAHGSTRWNVDAEGYVLQPADFLAVPPHVEHCMAGPPSATHHFFYAGIDLSRVLDRHPALAAAWLFDGCHHVAHADALLAPFRHLVREVTMQLPHRLEGISAALDCLVVEASRLVGNASGTAALVRGHPAVQVARRLLDAEYERHWSLTELAKRCGVAPHYLVDLFSSETGISPHRYLLERRIERAKELLSQGDLLVTDVAVELGFGSAQHFASMFRQIVGCSPREFRRRFREDPA